MTATINQPDMWDEVCLVGVINEAGTFISACAITQDITGLDFGDKQIESRASVCGGRLVKRTPMDDETLSLKVYPVNALKHSNNVGNGVVQWFHPQTSDKATHPIVIDNSLKREKFGIILLWSTKLPSAANVLPEAGQHAFRMQIKNAYMVSYKPSFDDKELSAEITFKWAPFTKLGKPNKREESTNGSVVLESAITSATADFS